MSQNFSIIWNFTKQCIFWSVHRFRADYLLRQWLVLDVFYDQQRFNLFHDFQFFWISLFDLLLFWIPRGYFAITFSVCNRSLLFYCLLYCKCVSIPFHPNNALCVTVYFWMYPICYFFLSTKLIYQFDLLIDPSCIQLKILDQYSWMISISRHSGW